MARKITELPEASAIADDDLFVIVQAADGLSKKASALAAGVSGGPGRAVVFSDFVTNVDTAMWNTAGSTGTGTVIQLPAGNADADEGLGIWKLDTGAGAGKALISHSAIGNYWYRGSLSYAIEARVKLPATPANITFLLGFDDFALGSAVVLAYNQGVGTWELYCRSTTSGTAANDPTAIAATAGWHTIRVEYESNVRARAFVDGVLVATVSTPAAIPHGVDAMTVEMYAQRSAGPVEFVLVDWLRVAGDRA